MINFVFIGKLPLIEPIYDKLVAIATHVPAILAALITGLAVFTDLLDQAPFMGGDNFWDHWNQKDPVYQGDLLFGIQAAFLHFLLNANSLVKKLINWDFLNWFWEKFNLNTDLKRALAIFAANTALDAGMAIIFLTLAE
ncbi:MAG: hypothetical protein ACFFC7_33380 [Candidatus Hermodarchaeota archaeon]